VLLTGSIFVPALCAYSFRDQLKDHPLSSEDLIRLAAESGAGGIDLTTCWLPDTKDETLFRLRRAAYRLGVAAALILDSLRIHLALTAFQIFGSRPRTVPERYSGALDLLADPVLDAPAQCFYAFEMGSFTNLSPFKIDYLALKNQNAF
jgi:hypothetical protein